MRLKPIICKLFQFGDNIVKDHVPGAEALESEKHIENGSDLSESESEWEDVIHTSDDEEDEVKGPNAKKVSFAEKAGASKEDEFLTQADKEEKAQKVTSSRILTDAEFKKIESAQLKKQVQAYRKNKKGRKRTIREEAEDESVDIPGKHREELVNLANIEMVHKKRRHDKEARMATVLEGRGGREKFGSRKGKMNPKSSTTNKQKLKNKNFMMVKNKFKAKAKKSFVQKQRDLKKAMIRSQKFK